MRFRWNDISEQKAKDSEPAELSIKTPAKKRRNSQHA